MGALDPRLENFRALFAKKCPVIVHTAHVQGVQSSMRILHDEMGLDVIITHGDFLGFRGAEPLAERKMKVNSGPRIYWFDPETARIEGQAAEWWRRGTTDLSLNTDAPVVPQEELSYQAAMACWYGWLPYPALRGVTRVPADALGLSDRTGAIEVGKDADFGLWTGVEPARLVMPIDTHIENMSRAIGLTRRRSRTWRMAEEITARLATVERWLDATRPPTEEELAGLLDSLRRLAGSLPRAERLSMTALSR